MMLVIWTVDLDAVRRRAAFNEHHHASPGAMFWYHDPIIPGGLGLGLGLGLVGGWGECRSEV